jgi:GNAT superfamily N-acetyltransferase
VTAPKASDFYALRRTGIRDAVAGVAFLAGFIGAGPIGWAMMQADVNAGDMARGLLRFLAIVIAGGVVAGVAGLAVGAGIGRAWQWMHAAGRRPIPVDPVDTRVDAPLAKSSRPDVAYAIRYEGEPSTEDYATLARASGTHGLSPSTISGTANVGAWLDGAMVGIARVLTDGQRSAILVEILVDPRYRRIGIGRQLMQRAAAVAGPAGLTVVAPRDAVRFFEKVGALRGPIALLMKT